MTGRRSGQTTLTLTYQRELSAGRYFDVFNTAAGTWQPVATTLRVTVTR